MIKKIKIQKPKMPINFKECNDAKTEIIQNEKLEDDIVKDDKKEGIETV